MHKNNAYKTEMLTTAQDYLETYEEKYSHAIPSISGLALVLGVTRRTLQRWCKDDRHPALCRILDQVKAIQKVVVLEKGLKGEFNSTLCKLVLSQHGMHDQQRVTRVEEVTVRHELTGAVAELLTELVTVSRNSRENGQISNRNKTKQLENESLICSAGGDKNKKISKGVKHA